jgi:hypothetical protein
MKIYPEARLKTIRTMVENRLRVEKAYTKKLQKTCPPRCIKSAVLSGLVVWRSVYIGVLVVVPVIIDELVESVSRWDCPAVVFKVKPARIVCIVVPIIG